MRRKLILHPLLAASFPPLFLWSHNIRSVPASVEIIPLLVTLAASTLLWAALARLMRRDWQRSAMVCSSIVMLFFSFTGILESVLRTGVTRFVAEVGVTLFVTLGPLVVVYLV